ncbi:hypothetical protein BGP_3232 [Beggiatoa sp. PS]|nr:hypothetical protein BGP_3232 [Beggiatoa sp. PS]
MKLGVLIIDSLSKKSHFFNKIGFLMDSMNVDQKTHFFNSRFHSTVGVLVSFAGEREGWEEDH